MLLLCRGSLPGDYDGNGRLQYGGRGVDWLVGLQEDPFILTITTTIAITVTVTTSKQVWRYNMWKRVILYFHKAWEMRTQGLLNIYSRSIQHTTHLSPFHRVLKKSQLPSNPGAFVLSRGTFENLSHCSGTRAPSPQCAGQKDNRAFFIMIFVKEKQGELKLFPLPKSCPLPPVNWRIDGGVLVLNPE